MAAMSRPTAGRCSCAKWHARPASYTAVPPALRISARQRSSSPVEDLITQRVYALALGDEDLNDHDRLRHDPLLVVLVGTPDPTGQERPRARDRGKAFAGKRTCNRLDQRLVELFLEAHATPPQEIVRARDATDDPLHGHQEARFFHGDYGHYCSVPLSIFASAFLRCARRRPANRDARAGAVEETARLVGAIRARWPTVQIMRRVASGFCRESLMAWCAAHQVDSGFGVAKNRRLLAQGQAALAQAQAQYAQTGPPARVCTACLSRPLDTWSQEHRGVAKAEYLAKGATPRLVGTSLAPAQWTAQALYEERYYARGDMANRIKRRNVTCLPTAPAPPSAGRIRSGSLGLPLRISSSRPSGVWGDMARRWHTRSVGRSGCGCSRWERCAPSAYGAAA